MTAWNYSSQDELTSQPAAAPLAPPTSTLPDLSNPEVLRAETAALQEKLPDGAVARLLDNNAIAPEDRIDGLRTLIEASYASAVTTEMVEASPTAIRDAMQWLKVSAERAAQPPQVEEVVAVAPQAALAPAPRPAVAHHRDPERREATLGEALAFVFERGPDATPARSAARSEQREANVI